jgi:hypothetical protein
MSRNVPECPGIPLRFLLRHLAQGHHELGEATVPPYEEETMPVLPSSGGVQNPHAEQQRLLRHLEALGVKVAVKNDAA